MLPAPDWVDLLLLNQIIPLDPSPTRPSGVNQAVISTKLSKGSCVDMASHHHKNDMSHEVLIKGVDKPDEKKVLEVSQIWDRNDARNVERYPVRAVRKTLKLLSLEDSNVGEFQEKKPDNFVDLTSRADCFRVTPKGCTLTGSMLPTCCYLEHCKVNSHHKLEELDNKMVALGKTLPRAVTEVEENIEEDVKRNPPDLSLGSLAILNTMQH